MTKRRVKSDLVKVDADERALSQDIIDSAREYYDADKSKNTKRVYASQWRMFKKWCTDNGRKYLPSTPETLASYITTRANAGRAVSTIALGIMAVAYEHEQAGFKPPHKADRNARVILKRMWNGIRRKVGVQPRPPAPLLSEQLKRILEVLDVATPAGVRDKALLLIGFSAALRRSELVKLDVEDIDRIEKGLVLRIGGRSTKNEIRRTKTDQVGAGLVTGIPRAKDEAVCATAALERWLDVAGIASGPVFREVDRHGNIGKERLCDRSVARIVKRAVAMTGADSERFSGHSLRSGMATSAARAGKNLKTIRDQGRWKSFQSLDRYIREIAVFTENAAEGILD